MPHINSDMPVVPNSMEELVATLDPIQSLMPHAEPTLSSLGEGLGGPLPPVGNATTCAIDPNESFEGCFNITLHTQPPIVADHLCGQLPFPTQSQQHALSTQPTIPQDDDITQENNPTKLALHAEELLKQGECTSLMQGV